MSEPPRLVQQNLVARVRPGADGVLLQRIGVWSEPFEVITKGEAANFIAAENLYVQYVKQTGNIVSVVWSDFPLLSVNHRFCVLHVEPLRIHSIVLGVGLNGTYFAECVCRWRLQPVMIVPEPEEEEEEE